MTNARWTLTIVLLTPIVQILWDRFSAPANLDMLVMVKYVKVIEMHFNSPTPVMGR